ncbi:MAG: hypothetical protein J5787_04325 [Alphaproteobacteria bacterium]|nr:hypothetical protein [Alphaproteobacteria bacterium]MBO4643675.1 hypothetical protein [Alphaproteobacteria bacterium]
MQFGKFVLNFIMIFFLLMFIVWAGTAFDNEMTFTWYSYTIVGVLSTFYAWTKSVNMNQIAGETPAAGREQHHVVHHHRPEHVNHSHRPMP